MRAFAIVEISDSAAHRLERETVGSAVRRMELAEELEAHREERSWLHRRLVTLRDRQAVTAALVEKVVAEVDRGD